jgi:hypothetical protein
MRKTLLVVVLFASLVGCTGIENKDVKDLRAIHKSYRDHSCAKKPEDQEKLDQLGDKIDGILIKFDELTR